MNEEEYSFTIINKDGIEVTYDVLSMITDKDSRIYLLYTDYLLDENGRTRVLASELVQEKDSYILKDIDDKEKLAELVQASKDVYNEGLNQIRE